MQRNSSINFVVKLAVFGLFIILIFAVVSKQLALNEIESQKEKLESQIDEVRDTIDEIQIRLDSPVDDEYIERVIREELGYCNPDEVIFSNDLVN